MSDIAERVKRIVVEHLGVDEAKVTENASFVDDLGADSLDVVELVMALEEEFGLEISDEDAEKLRTVDSGFTRHVVGELVPGWLPFELAYDESSLFIPHGETMSSDPVLLYFTSGTTAKPKLVVHTQRSYPVGHLSTMYWIGLREGDVHMNVSSPGWAKNR